MKKLLLLALVAVNMLNATESSFETLLKIMPTDVQNPTPSVLNNNLSLFLTIINEQLNKQMPTPEDIISQKEKKSFQFGTFILTKNDFGEYILARSDKSVMNLSIKQLKESDIASFVTAQSAQPAPSARVNKSTFWQNHNKAVKIGAGLLGTATVLGTSYWIYKNGFTSPFNKLNLGSFLKFKPTFSIFKS